MLEHQIQKDRKAIDAYINLGKLYRLKGEWKRAHSLHKNILSTPDLSRSQLRQTYIEMGFDALLLGIENYGIPHFEKGISWLHTPPSAYLGLSLAYYQKQDYRRSIKYLRKVSPQNEPNLELLVSMCLKLADNKGVTTLPLSEHVTYLKLAKSLRPNSTRVAFKLVEKYIALNDFTAARSELRQIISSVPPHDMGTLVKLYETLYFELSDYAALENEYKELISRGHESSAILIALAKILYKKKKLAEAESTLYRAQALDPQNPMCLFLLLEVKNGALSPEELKLFTKNLLK